MHFFSFMHCVIHSLKNTSETPALAEPDLFRASEASRVRTDSVLGKLDGPWGWLNGSAVQWLLLDDMGKNCELARWCLGVPSDLISLDVDSCRHISLDRHLGS